MDNSNRISEIKQHASGYWISILADLAPSLAEAVSNPRKHWPCPVHGGKDGLRAFSDVAETGGIICNTCGARPDGFAALMWANDWSFKTAFTQVDRWLGGQPRPTREQRLPKHLIPDPALDPRECEWRAHRIKQFWRHTIPPTYSVPLYLRSRGLDGIKADLSQVLREMTPERYTPENADPDQQFSMVAPLTTISGVKRSLHITALTARGAKANVDVPKRIMTPVAPRSLNGTAIRLFPPASHMAISEGIETALAVHLLTGLPVIAAANAALMRSVLLPMEVRRIDIYADKDRSLTGEHAARELAARLNTAEGRDARIYLPDVPIPDGKKSIDWLDIYNLRRKAA